MKDKIYSILHQTMPPKMVAQYNNHSAEVFVSLVPKVMEATAKSKVLLFEEEVVLAEDYLKNILYFKK